MSGLLASGLIRIEYHRREGRHTASRKMDIEERKSGKRCMDGVPAGVAAPTHFSDVPTAVSDNRRYVVCELREGFLVEVADAFRG